MWNADNGYNNRNSIKDITIILGIFTSFELILSYLQR